MTINGLLLSISLMMWSIVIGVSMSRASIMDPFHWMTLASARDLADGVEMAWQDQMFNPILASIIAQVLGTDFTTFGTHPLGALFIPLLYTATVATITGKKSAGAIVGFYVVFEYSLMASHYNSFMYAWTRSLFLAWIILMTSVVRQQRELKRQVVLVAIVFFAVLKLHPGVTLWMLAFPLALGSYAMIMWRPSRAHPRLLVLGIGCILIVAVSSQLLYHRILADAVTLDLAARFGEITSRIGGLLTGPDAPDSNYSASPAELFQGHGLLIVARSAFLIAASLFLVGAILRRRFLRSLPSAGVMFSLAIVGVLHTVGYLSQGHFSIRFATSFFPVLIAIGGGLLIYGQLGGRQNGRLIVSSAKVIISLLLLFALATGLPALWVTMEAAHLDPHASRTSAVLFSEHSLHEGATITSDFDTLLARGFILGASRSVDGKFHDGASYDALIYGDVGFDGAVLIDMSAWSEPLPTRGWTFQVPLQDFSRSIYDNDSIISAYDSGTFASYVPN